MAEVLIAALVVGGTAGNEGLPDGPGQVSGAAANKRIIVSEGPIKKEYIFLQQQLGDTFPASDTLSTRLARPFAASVKSVNTDDGGANGFLGSCTIELREANASYKTITLLDCNNISAQGLIVEVLGY